MTIVVPALRAAVAPAPWVKNELWRNAREVPALDQPFADNKSLIDIISGQQLITFTRASAGTYVGSDGLIKTATTNEARFDHDPETGESLGLLIEEQRTNLITNSENVAAYFTEQNATPTANAASSPDGTTTATLLTPDTTLGSHSSFNASISFLAATTYSYSVFVKPNGYTFVQLLFSGGFGNVNAWVNFNLSGAGSIGFSGGGELSKQIQAFPGGWYRCTITATSGSSVSAGGPVYLVLDSDRNSRDASYAGNNTDGAYLWGAQVEEGAFPTSYIPTTGSTATRSADVASITGANFSSWYRQDEGTIYGDAQTPYAVTKFPIIADGRVSSTDIVQIGFFTEVLSVGYIKAGNVDQVINYNTGLSGVRRRRVAFGMKADDFSVSTNGGALVSDTSGVMPTNIVDLYIGSQVGGNFLNGTIRRLVYWDQRLPNEVLQTITL